MSIRAGILHRPRLIEASEYLRALRAIRDALGQLKPNAEECAVCGDGGHQAWECHHNPVAMMLEAQALQGQWRCFHCGEVFTDERAATEHFGSRRTEQPDYPACVTAMDQASIAAPDKP